MASGYYDITSKTLGKGHYGVVKLGRHCLTGEPVAMKIIEKSRLNNDSLHQLGTEIRILFRLSEYEHPNILKLYQTIDTEDRLFLVTEYCGPHACDLHEYLSRSRDGLKGRTAQVFFTQIVSAIAYCHSLGIVHRDLKPENILVTDHRHLHTNIVFDGDQDHEFQYPLLKLIDFGFANQWVPDEKMRTSCGTLAYSAPELLLGEPYDGTKVDVWGLGLMLYILLYGGNPFMQINDNETLTKILDCSFSTPAKDDVDSSAIELLRSLIKRNPDKRLTIDAILRHNWFSGIPKTFEPMLKCPSNQSEQTNCPKQIHNDSVPQVMSPTLPSISECGPLKNLNRSADDDSKLTKLQNISEKPNHNRTRSLCITRSYSRATQQLALTKTRSSMNLGRLYQQANNLNTSLPTTNFLRSSPLYRPTSPDVSGLVLLTEEEKKLHKNVLKEVFRLTKLIDSEASIEASLKNARTTHRLFNENSIKPAQYVSKLSAGLLRTLTHSSHTSSDKQRMSGSGGNTRSTSVDKLTVINNKLSNDDYIYATYQLTRDRVLRDTREQLKKQSKVTRVSKQEKQQSGLASTEDAGSNNSAPAKEAPEATAGEDRVSCKENEHSSGQQRKLLQPQHKMRDKFTSFFRSGSTSPSGSFNVTIDSKGSGSETTTPVLGSQEVDQHEAFNDHNNEISGGSGARYFGTDAEPQENAVAYALPLARKCSLVSEESGCSTEFPDNQ